MAEKHKFTEITFSFPNHRQIYPSFLVLFYLLCSFNCILSDKDCTGVPCYNGKCVENNTICQCNDGWTGLSCSYCTGRVRINATSGIITDGVGNYSVDNKCMWLLEPYPPSAPLRLTPTQFATECGWDHLYIFDGDSTFSPQIAAYSGLVLPDIDVNNSLDEIVAPSGKAYLYFYSDAAYNMTGFTIQYSVGDCPRNCSGQGTCLSTWQCACNAGYTGPYCETLVCPNSCSNNGNCNRTSGHCVCNSYYKGWDCSIPVKEESWIRYNDYNHPAGRASAASLLVGDSLVISGGYAFGQKVDFLITYNITSHDWQSIVPLSTENPTLLYGHSMVRYKDSLYLFGGVNGEHNESRLWIYNITTNRWTFHDYNETEAVAGHSAVVVGDVMYVIFGHSPVYGYMNTVREILLDSDNLQMSVVPTTGALVKGGYGHSSIYHEKTGLIYVYGGYTDGNNAGTYSLTDRLYSYQPAEKLWKILASSGSVRYLHSAVWLGELMLVFGGNTHNDTSVSFGAKCYSPDFMAYDPECNTWKNIKTKKLPRNAARYGHIAQAYNESNGRSYMLVFGGFTGVMQSDIMVYEPGACGYDNQTSCVASFPGRVCVWTERGCMEREMALKSRLLNQSHISCPPVKGAEEFCSQQKSCGSCLSSAYNCKWCSNNCTTSCAATEQYPVTVIAKCPRKYNTICSQLINCHACLQHKECMWNKAEKACNYNQQEQDSFFETSTPKESVKDICGTPCHMYSDCDNCTSIGCMWCGSQQRCVETNSYVVSFLYGQCQEWFTQRNKCHATKCSDLYTCADCKSNPSCGWCNDVSNTGLGKCIPGAASGPISQDNVTGQHAVDRRVCPAERWYFIDCPSCQCNGHSTCNNVSDKCDACQNLTTGLNCQECMDGYYGNPKNGGNCTACSCNGLAEKCNSLSGSCYCRTRGVKGDKCQICDVQNNYFGNPNNGGTCYYDLRTDYQFTFNLSKPDDEYYTAINFMNIPVANDRDVDFTLNCSGSAYINITWKSKSHPQEQYKTQEYLCTYFRSKFEHKDYNFGPDDNVTFFVYVYGFKTPFWLQISFSQFPKIDLVHFFVTFFSCFLSLLIIAAVLYKIKHKYDSYRRRQRMIVEMAVMASRPFAQAVLEIERRVENTGGEKKETNPDLRKRKRPSNKPGQIALEPLSNQKAAVLSLFVQLPCGDEEWSPPGHSGLAIGSALVNLGHQRKQSAEFVKSDKSKHHHHKKQAIVLHDTNI